MDEAFQLVYQTSLTLGDVEDMDRRWRHGMLDRIVRQRKLEQKEAEAKRAASKRRR